MSTVYMIGHNKDLDPISALEGLDSSVRRTLWRVDGPMPVRELLSGVDGVGEGAIHHPPGCKVQSAQVTFAADQLEHLYDLLEAGREGEIENLTGIPADWM